MGTDLLGDIRREIDARLGELRPALREYEQLLDAARALESEQARALESEQAPPVERRRAAATPRALTPALARGGSKPSPKKAVRAVRGTAREAILGALEHGSHTLGELVVVTAMSSANVNGNLRRLAAEGVVAKTQREGKTAWVLAAGS